MKRAGKLVADGFGPMDALHVACSENSACEVFLTTDDSLLKLAKRMRGKLSVRVENPVQWITEVIGL